MGTASGLNKFGEVGDFSFLIVSQLYDLETKRTT
jgi:hypothetical protein